MYYDVRVYHEEGRYDFTDFMGDDPDSEALFRSEKDKVRKALEGSRYKLLHFGIGSDTELYICFAPRYGIAGFLRKLAEIKMKIRTIGRKPLSAAELGPAEIPF
jgi:hypothetical protein